MNDILINICIAAIITSIFKILIPGETHKEQLRLVISCFFIITIMNMFMNNTEFAEIKEIFETKAIYNDYRQDYEKQTADELANNLRKQLFSELEKENIIPEKIYIDINISDNSSISISTIRLVFPDKNTYEAERAVKIAEYYTGNEIKVELEEQ